jgi:hypothetical protein
MTTSRPRRGEPRNEAPSRSGQEASRNRAEERPQQDDTMSDASSRPLGKAPVGYVCPPCGRFVRTDLDGVPWRGRTGSPSRFCSPGCRQAAYRRRQAGVPEDEPLQHRGGRGRGLARKTRSGDE